MQLSTPGFLYVIHKGVALYGGRVLPSGKEFGHDCILRDQTLCHAPARAMSYLEVYRLSRREIIEIARPFPVGAAKLRWAAVRLAFIRYMLKQSGTQWAARGHEAAAGHHAESAALLATSFDRRLARGSRDQRSSKEQDCSFSRRLARASKEAESQTSQARRAAQSAYRTESGVPSNEPQSKPMPEALNLLAEEDAPSLNEVQRGLNLVNDKVAHVDEKVDDIAIAVRQIQQLLVNHVALPPSPSRKRSPHPLAAVQHAHFEQGSSSGQPK